MATLRIDELADSMVLHFGGSHSRINAYTLAGAVTGIADAAKAVNASINPGYDIEIVVEAFDGGSFRTTLRALQREGRNLFSADSVRNIILGVVATIIYERVLSPRDQTVVNVGPTEIVIEVRKGERIVVPRGVYDSAQQAKRSPTVQNGIGRAIQSIVSDSAIASFGVGKDPKMPPKVVLPRDLFVALPASTANDEPDVRILEETTEVQILRAILERSRRRWEFVWNGLRISAPVLDDAFYSDFFAHKITVAPGDSLRVKLRLRQARLPDLGIYVTQSYEVVEVLKHIPVHGQQTDMSLRKGA